MSNRKWLPPEEFAATLPKATMFGAVFFTDEDDRPVQLRATYSITHPWQWPGGVAEPGERPWETAVRECLEETGLRVEGPPKLLATVFGLPGKDWPLATVGWVFDGGRLTPGQLAGIVLDPDEHDEVVLHPEDAVGLLEHPDERRSEGCCGPEGLFGINRICPCGAEVGTLLADCWTACELHLHPTRVRAA